MTLDEFKKETDIVDFIEEYTPLKRQGAQYVGICPFPSHDDSTPSFFVHPGRKIFYCHGCGKGGSVIDFYRHYHNISFGKACKELGIDFDKQPEYGSDLIVTFLERKKNQGGLF